MCWWKVCLQTLPDCKTGLKRQTHSIMPVPLSSWIPASTSKEGVAAFPCHRFYPVTECFLKYDCQLDSKDKAKCFYSRGQELFMCDMEIWLKILSIYPGIQPQDFLPLQTDPHLPVKLVGQSSLPPAPVTGPSVCLGPSSTSQQLLSSPCTWAGFPCAADQCAASSIQRPPGCWAIHLVLQEGLHSTNYYLPCSCTCPAQCHWTINISLSEKPPEFE